VAIGLAIIPAALAADVGPSRSTEAIVRALRDQSRKVNGFTAELSVRAGGASQSGTLLFLAPDRLRMEMKVARLGEQKIVSDGRVLWTITPQARLATKIDLEVVRRSWGRPLPNQAMAIRDVFEVVKPGTVRFVREEAVRGVMTRLFEAVPEAGVDPGPGAALPDRMRAWVGSDGLLRRQVLMRGDEVLMDARFRITDRNPRIRPGQFRFEPPPDYQVQDLTESTLEALRSLAAGRT
jgi:outer membrane lipoprotein-sorting protein